MTKDEEYRNLILTIKAHADCKKIFRRFWPDHYREVGNCRCPFHDDRDPSMQVSKELAYCHSESLALDAIDLYARGAGCSKGEAIRSLASELNLAIPSVKAANAPRIDLDYFSRRMREALQKELPQKAVQYLESRGIRPETLLKLKERKLIGWDSKLDGIAFPLCGWDGKKLLGIQVIPVDGGKKRFVKGSRSRDAFFRFGFGSEVLVFCEAIIDALSVAEAVPTAEGVALLAAGLTDKLGSLELSSAPVLFLDNDDAGRKGVAKALRKLGPRFRIVDWSLAPEEASSKDVNDLLKGGNADAIENMVTAARLPTAEEMHRTFLSNTASSRPGEKGEGEDGKKQTQAQLLIAMAGDIDLFHSPEEMIYASFSMNEHRETWYVRSKNFRRWLSHRFFLDQEKPPGSQAIQDALNILEAKGQFEGPKIEVFVRVGKIGESVYIDLANESWDAIEITGEGWRVVHPSPVKFKRTKGMIPLPYPERGGSLDDLRHLLNLPDGNALTLIIGWLIQAACPTGPYPILNLEGEQGAGKSAAARIIKSIIDPSTAPIRTSPREERDLLISATHSWIMAFDNLSGIPVWLSDALCRLSTGGGYSIRELYSNDEETIFNASRPLLLTGIDQIAARHDLADRSIIVSLPAIPEEKRVPEKDLLLRFRKEHPKYLGAVCEAISTAIRNLPHTQLEALPRMADFALWVSAAEPALPWRKGDFVHVYQRNRREAIELALDSDVVSSVVREFMAQRTEWNGTASELLDLLYEQVPERVQNSKAWPKGSNALSNRLRRSATFLRASGIEVEFFRAHHTGKRTIAIKKGT